MTETIQTSTAPPSEPTSGDPVTGFEEADESGRGRSFHFEIFLMAFASLLLEVAYTRVISFKLYYYYTFLVIGLALLGIGCGGVAVAVSKRLRRASTEGIIMWGLTVAAASVLVGYVVVALTPVDTLALWQYGSGASLRNLALLVVICLALFASFISIGIMLATLFGRRTAQIGRLYFADLLGAGLACAIVVFALYWVGPAVTIITAGLLMALGALRMALTRPSSAGSDTPPTGAARRFNPTAGVSAAGLAVALVAMLAVPALLPEVRSDSTKNIAESEDFESAYTGWGALFRVDAYEIGDLYFLYHDGMLGSAIHRYNGDPASLTRFDADSRRFAFTTDGAPRDDVLIIGAAGGNEILASLYFGADRIDAIELNPITYSLVTDRFADYAGRIAEDPRVNYVQGDGRTFLSRSDEQYDLIWYPAPDSYSATNAAASGAFVLSESYLYTVETVEESLAHLRDDGVLIAQFGELDYDVKPNRTARYVATARQALGNRGVTDPGAHIVVLRSPGIDDAAYSSVLVKPTPFTDAEIAALVDAADLVPGSAVSYAPGSDPVITDDAPAQIASLPDGELRAYLDAQPYEVDAITDNGPFFWHFASFPSVLANYGTSVDAIDSITGIDLEDSLGERVLVLLLGLAVVLGAIFLLLPFITIREQWRQLPRKGTSLIYFSCLGLGFMLLEISLIQRLVLFLGFPTYSLTVTLASILIFTGVGALLSGRVAHLGRRVLPPLALAVTALTAFYLFALPPITTALLGWPLAGRVLITFVILAPLGITLGMFMPLGLGAVAGLSPFHREYVAWGWAVNGFASVTGAVLTTVLAMMFGFTTVMVIALVLYLLAVVTLRVLMGPVRRPVPAS